MSNLLRTLTVAGILAAPLAATAAAAPAAPVKAPPTTLADVFTASGITLSGAVDASYDYKDVDGPPAFHAFDTTPQGFTLHQVNLTLSKDFGSGVSVTVNPIFGDDANLLGYGDTFLTGATGVTYPNNDDFDLTQAYIQYAAGSFTTILGRYVTLAGYEVINPSGNTNASRSLLFFQQPLLHTGVRSTFKATDALSFTAGVLDSAIGSNKTDNNSDVSFEVQAAFSSGPFAAYLTGYSGNEDATGAPPYGLAPPVTVPAPQGGAKLRTDVADLVSSFSLNDNMTFAINADYITTEVATGGHSIVEGVAGYANLKFGAFRVAPRVEYLSFDNNIVGNDGWQREETLTLGYSLSSALELMVEGRNDQFDSGFFSIPQRNRDATPNNDQTTATIKAVLKF